MTQFLFVVSPIIIYELTKSLTLGSLATSLIMSSDLPFDYPVGRLADNIGRKKTLLMGIAFSFVGLFLILTSRLLSVYWLFWAGIVIFGSSTAFSVVNRAAITDMYPKKRGQSLGYLNTGGFIGALMAPVIVIIITGVSTGLYVNYYDLVLYLCVPFLVFSGLMLFGIRKDTLIIAKMLRKNGAQPVNFNQCDAKEQLFPNQNTKRDLILAILISSISVGAVGISLSLSPMLLHILNAELWWITFAVMLISFGASGLSFFTGKTSDKIGQKNTILIGASLMGFGLCVLPLAQNVYFIAFSNFLVGLGAGAMAVATTSLICNLTRIENRGKILGLNSLVVNIPTLVLPPIAATLFSLSGSLVSMLGIVLSVVSFLSVAFLTKNLS
jgi:MFS family permease